MRNREGSGSGSVPLTNGSVPDPGGPETCGSGSPTILNKGLADLQSGHTEFQGDVSELPALLHAEISKINISI